MNYQVDEQTKNIVLFEYGRLDQMIRSCDGGEFDYEQFIKIPTGWSDSTRVQSSRNKSSQVESDAIKIAEIKQDLQMKKEKILALEKALQSAINEASKSTTKFIFSRKIAESLRSNLIYGIPFACQTVSVTTMHKYRKIAIYYAALNLGLIEERKGESD